MPRIVGFSGACATAWRAEGRIAVRVMGSKRWSGRAAKRLVGIFFRHFPEGDIIIRFVFCA